MRVAREVPLNPNIVLYHVDVPQTREIVEAYRVGFDSARQPFSGIIDCGAESVHVTRYRWAIRKPRDKDPLDFMAAVEPGICEWAGIDAIPALRERSERSRAFEVPSDATLAGRREVYEGSRPAEQNPLAAALFNVHGVAEVILDPLRVRISRGALFEWSALEPAISAVIDKSQVRSGGDSIHGSV
ncbi:hypothetical protein FJZ36_03495 [Candidatus Poribacteria bacterium]|nr:hypothetical protein [Candidatus Poribacteria bacterium]